MPNIGTCDHPSHALHRSRVRAQRGGARRPPALPRLAARHRSRRRGPRRRRRAAPPSELVAGLEAVCDELGIALVSNDENSGFSATVNVGLEFALAHRARRRASSTPTSSSRSPAGSSACAPAPTPRAAPPPSSARRLLYPNGLIQHAGIFFSLLHRDWLHRFQYGPADLPEALTPTRCPVTAALQLIRCETLEQIGLYDEAYKMCFEDLDYCLRVFEAGLECIYEPTVVATHREKFFRGKADAKIDRWTRESTARMLNALGRDRPVAVGPGGAVMSLPKTLFLSRGSNAVAWYRCALPALALGADWICYDGTSRRHTKLVWGRTAAPARARRHRRLRRRRRPAAARRRLAEADPRVAGARRRRAVRDRRLGPRRPQEGRPRLRRQVRSQDGRRTWSCACARPTAMICSTEWLADRYRSLNPTHLRLPQRASTSSATR